MSTFYHGKKYYAFLFLAMLLFFSENSEKWITFYYKKRSNQATNMQFKTGDATELLWKINQHLYKRTYLKPSLIFQSLKQQQQKITFICG